MTEELLVRASRIGDGRATEAPWPPLVLAPEKPRVKGMERWGGRGRMVVRRVRAGLEVGERPCSCPLSA